MNPKPMTATERLEAAKAARLVLPLLDTDRGFVLVACRLPEEARATMLRIPEAEAAAWPIAGTGEIPADAVAELEPVHPLVRRRFLLRNGAKHVILKDPSAQGWRDFCRSLTFLG